MVVAIVLFSITGGTSVTWERTRADGKATTVLMKCEGGSARFETTSPEGAHTVIWDGAGKTLVSLKPADKTYTRLTEAKIAELKAQQAARVAQLKERLATMPASERPRVEAMLAAVAEEKPAAWKFTPTGKKAKVGKYDCELNDAQHGEGVKLQMCLAPWASAPAKKEDLECFKAISGLFASLSRGLRDSVETGPEDVTTFPGLPMQTTRDLGDGKKVTSTLKAVERGVKLPPEAFVVPEGYQPVELR